MQEVASSPRQKTPSQKEHDFLFPRLRDVATVVSFFLVPLSLLSMLVVWLLGWEHTATYCNIATPILIVSLAALITDPRMSAG